ncbi:hypothetical protein E4U58_002882 [Claviceps cyperi]|nr:hypothetical protein E4U58_002882 [Claviceps cyperi]
MGCRDSTGGSQWQPMSIQNFRTSEAASSHEPHHEQPKFHATRRGDITPMRPGEGERPLRTTPAGDSSKALRSCHGRAMSPENDALRLRSHGAKRNHKCRQVVHPDKPGTVVTRPLAAPFSLDDDGRRSCSRPTAP